MRDRVWIITGLVIFLAAITYPAWHGAEARSTSQPPVLVLPAHAKQCVAPVNYMRKAHMKLLLDWRTSVVRDNERKYVSYDGKVYDMNLTGTCMKCHEKKGFCDRCHHYAGVDTPYCWRCHVDPAQAKVKNP